MRRLILLLLVLLIALLPTAGSHAQSGDRTPAEARLAAVTTWFYYLSVDLSTDDLTRLIASDYEMVVIDPIVTEQQNTGYDIAATVHALQETGKLVIAYIDIGQAEEYRTYWQAGWQIGNPAWIVGADPDGWSGNYPVAFWYDEWQAIWFDDETGILPMLVEVGFDGVYLDWVEAYDDENLIAFAEQEGLDATQEMLWFVEDISTIGKALREDFIVIAQNAAPLLVYEDYRAVIDGVAQEAVWFDGAADGLDPEGDCPLPATEADIDSAAYRASLSAACLTLLDEDPESQLHTASAWYLEYLRLAQAQGEIVLTVDYALEEEHIAWVMATSRALGFVPFVGARALDRYHPPYGADQP